MLGSHSTIIFLDWGQGPTFRFTLPHLAVALVNRLAASLVTPQRLAMRHASSRPRWRTR
jgi:hypothetical protein